MNQRLKFGILGLLFGIVIVLFWKFDIGKILTSALSWIGGLGWLGVIVFIMLYILATVFF
ncbi:TVP38/TMEM64 family protein, partial [Candidatus Woesearchaeota archaeon]|nr:TVP38/TMEM64 family protein [Candidatus Woesearchaeota archaeon]